MDKENKEEESRYIMDRIKGRIEKSPFDFHLHSDNYQFLKDEFCIHSIIYIDLDADRDYKENNIYENSQYKKKEEFKDALINEFASNEEDCRLIIHLSMDHLIINFMNDDLRESYLFDLKKDHKE